MDPLGTHTYTQRDHTWTHLDIPRPTDTHWDTIECPGTLQNILDQITLWSSRITSRFTWKSLDLCRPAWCPAPTFSTPHFFLFLPSLVLLLLYSPAHLDALLRSPTLSLSLHPHCSRLILLLLSCFLLLSLFLSISLPFLCAFLSIALFLLSLSGPLSP